MGGDFNPDAPVQQGVVAYRHCTHPAHEGDPVLPATSKFFKVKRRPDGSERYARHCRKCQYRDETNQEKSLVEAAKKYLSAQTLKRGKGTPNFGDLLDEVYRKAGGMRKVATIIAGFINDDTPKGRVDRRTTAMKVFEATQKQSENEALLELKKQGTAELQAQLKVLAQALGISASKADELLALDDLTIDEPDGSEGD